MAAEGIAELRRRVDVDADAVVATIRRALGDDPPPRREAELWWVLGLAHRAVGRAVEAREDQERAWSLAIQADERALAARIAVSLAYDVASAGDVAGALWILEQAEPDVAPADRPGLVSQRGTLYYRLGRLRDAVDAMAEARVAARRVGDVAIEVRALSNLGASWSLLGDHRVARRHLGEAVDLAERHGLLRVAALAHNNLAYVASVLGDLPVALDEFAAAEATLLRADAGEFLPRTLADHAVALADANLLGDAEALIERALDLAAAQGDELELAELQLIGAQIDLARHHVEEARDGAAAAEARFAAQGRDSWLSVAASVRLRAEAALRPDDPRIADELAAHAAELRRHGWRYESITDDLLAGMVRLAAGLDDEAAGAIDRVRAEAGRGRALDRILLARVRAVQALRRHDPATARRAVSGGLRIAAASQAALGSLETRAHAAEHGAALIDVGARIAVAAGRPRELLERIEAMRTMVWSAPVVRPPDDEVMAETLAELRRVSARSADPDLGAADRQVASRSRLRLERQVRDLARRSRGEGPRSGLTTRRAVAQAITDGAELGERQLLAYGNLDGELLAVGVDRRRCRLHRLGSAEHVGPYVDAAAFALHRLNRRGLSEASRAAAAALADAADALAALLLPVDILRSGRSLVVVPTGLLHGVAWASLPPLAGRAVSVSPSLTGWSVAARAAAARADGRHAGGTTGRRGDAVALVAGPGLRHADDEVAALAGIYDRGEVLQGATATAAACIDAIDRAELVHLACHGHLRTDNALFSTLTMHDGPVTVYDLERASMPDVVVLSACSVGASTTLNGGTLLGLASAVGTFGASSVIAPLVPVNDEALVPFMVRLHTGLAEGLAPAAALARAAVVDGRPDPVAAAFVAIGA